MDNSKKKNILCIFAVLSLVVMLTGTAYSSERSWKYSKEVDNFSDEITRTDAFVLDGGKNKISISFICRFPEKRLNFLFTAEKFVSSKEDFHLTLDYRVDKKSSALNIGMYGYSFDEEVTTYGNVNNALSTAIAKDLVGGNNLRLRVNFKGNAIIETSVTLKGSDKAIKKVFSDCGIKL